MNLARLIQPELIRLELRTQMPPKPAEPMEPPDRERFLWCVKEAVIGELVDLLDLSGRIGNTKRLRTDLVNREKKASTGLSDGIAVPHVRTREAREFVMAVARSTPGVAFGCQDGRPAHIFFAMVSPPYDDTLYLRIYKRIAEAVTYRGAMRTLLEARDEHEVLRALKDF
jgi:mannitol/fructose-specific phosphotransferase system IIA component (Ntr-type)